MAKKADKAATRKGRSQPEEADKHVRACSNVVQVTNVGNFVECFLHFFCQSRVAV